MKSRLLSSFKHEKGLALQVPTFDCYTSCRDFGQMYWSFSGRRYISWLQHLSLIHHLLPQEFASAEVVECIQLFLLAATFNAAIQHFGSSMPSSLLKHGLCRKCGWPLSAVLAQSITVTSSHLIGQWFSRARSSSAYFCSAPSGKQPGVPSSWFQASSVLFLQCKSCHSCRGSATLWPALLLHQGSFTLVSIE